MSGEKVPQDMSESSFLSTSADCSLLSGLDQSCSFVENRKEGISSQKLQIEELEKHLQDAKNKRANLHGEQESVKNKLIEQEKKDIQHTNEKLYVSLEMLSKEKDEKAVEIMSSRSLKEQSDRTLWNDVIEAFRNGMPTKKHRRRMQSYNDCFSATDAVTWLHCYLLNNPNFGLKVTRGQTVNLLQKFLKCHVIESAILKSKKKSFEDDSHLFKFTTVFHQSKPSALCLIQSPSFHNIKEAKKKSNALLVPPISAQKENLPECHFVERKISANEIKEIWEKVTLNRLSTLLPEISFQELIEEKHIDGHLIKHNVSRMSKTGVVCLIDKTDDIPHWVISAMKCLANWPNASGSGSCLPNYPGFEKDVFKVVRDYFLNPQVPLLPEFLTPVLLNIFTHFMTDDCDCSSIKKSSLSYNDKSSQLSHSLSADFKTSTPLTSENLSKNSSLKSLEVYEGKLLLDDPEVMWEYPSIVYFETDFSTAQPITRMISDPSIAGSSSHAGSVGSIESVSTISMCSSSQKSLILNDRVFSPRTPLKSWRSNMYLQDEVEESPQCLKAKSEFSRLSVADCMSLQNYKAIENSGSLSPECNPEAHVYVCEINDLNTSDLSSKTITESLENIELCDEGYSDSFKKNPTSQSSSLLSQKHPKCNNWKERFDSKFIKENINYEDLKLSFQLILVILPSANRRQLHLLLRLINKVLKNGKFEISSVSNMREFLIETFLPAIVTSESTSNIHLCQMVAFLLDYCELLFQPPPGLKEEALEICRQSSRKIKFSVDDTCLLTYCEMVSKQQYEEQKKATSVEALKGLLNSILRDGNISDKDRKRKLKQFKNSHPDIYLLQFPEDYKTGSKPKSSFINKFLRM